MKICKYFAAVILLSVAACAQDSHWPDQDTMLFGTARDAAIQRCGLNCLKVGKFKVDSVEASGSVAVGATVLDANGAKFGTAIPLKGDGGDVLYTWAGPGTEPSVLSTDANTFGPSGEKVSGDTMSYAELLTLWDWFTTAANIPGWTVTKQAIGLDQSGTYQLYYYSFVRGGKEFDGKYDRTIVMVTGQHASEWAPTFALWRMWFHVAKGRLKLPDNVRYIVIPQGNPWGFSQSPRNHDNSRGVDINRNYAKYWDVDPSAAKGSSAESEAETVRIAGIVRDLKPTAFLDFHNAPSNPNCSYAMMMPYVDMQPFYEPVLRLVKALNAPYHSTCFTGLGTESASVNWTNSIRIDSVSVEMGNKTAAEGTGAWLAEYETWAANLLMAYAQRNANPLASPRETMVLQQTVDLASVASGACSGDNLWSAGGVAAFGDACIVSAGTALPSGTFLTCRITTNTAGGGGRWQLCNLSGAPVDRASDTYTIRAIR